MDFYLTFASCFFLPPQAGELVLCCSAGNRKGRPPNAPTILVAFVHFRVSLPRT